MDYIWSYQKAYEYIGLSGTGATIFVEPTRVMECMGEVALAHVCVLPHLGGRVRPCHGNNITSKTGTKTQNISVTTEIRLIKDVKSGRQKKSRDVEDNLS